GIPLLEACESEPEASLSVVYAPEDTKYLAPSDDDIAPAEDQPLPASPIALSLGYIVDLELIEEDLEIDPVDYAVDEEEETKPFETNESAATPPPPPRSPHTIIPLSQTGLLKAQKTIRPQPPMAASTEALIA
nr:hypothetical protein [Tanacetum cinerariifolium]